MTVRSIFVACLLAAGLSGSVLAHAPDSSSPGTVDRGSGDGSSWREWFTPSQHNETEAEIAAEQDQLAIQRTSAQMSGANDAEIAALDNLSQVLEVRAKIAAWRSARDRARQTGNKKLAAKLERRIHSAKREILDIALTAARSSEQPE